MGWDCYASTPDGDLIELAYREDENGHFSEVRPTPKIFWPFIEAAADVKHLVGDVDGLLQHAGLDCTPCAYALHIATGRDPWKEDWSGEEVKELWKKAQWPEEGRLYDGQQHALPRWAVESARAFLKVCAEKGYGVHFSW